MNLNNVGILEQITLYSRELRVSGLADYEEVVRRALPEHGFPQILLELLKREYERRQENQNERRLKQAGFPYTKSLEEMDLSRYGGKLSEMFVRELATCQFIRDRRNIVMFGNPGRGKTHMAIALGLKACEQGMSVLFKNVAKLSTELTEASESYVLGRLQKKLEKVDLLILDEVGYVQFNRRQSELLFDVFSERSERGSIIVTTNLLFSEWTTLFDGKALVAAMVDRLTYRGHLLDMNGESYRLEQSLKGRTGMRADKAPPNARQQTGNGGPCEAEGPDRTGNDKENAPGGGRVPGAGDSDIGTKQGEKAQGGVESEK